MYQLLRQYNVRLGGTERGPFRVLHRVGQKPVRQLEKMGVFPLSKTLQIYTCGSNALFISNLCYLILRETLASLRVLGLLTVDDRMIQKNTKNMVPICSVEVAILRHSWYNHQVQFSFEAISRKTSPEIYGGFPFEHTNESAICLPQFFVSFRRSKNDRDHSFAEFKFFVWEHHTSVCWIMPVASNPFCHTLLPTESILLSLSR